LVRPPVFGPVGEDIDWLVELCKHAQWVGIDAPFGWPDAAVEATATWASGGRWPEVSKNDLRYRLTDQCVRETTGLPPLSVSSDRIAVTAWRCARLLDALRTNGRPVDRTGTDDIFEVYPRSRSDLLGLQAHGLQDERQRSVQATTTPDTDAANHHAQRACLLARPYLCPTSLHRKRRRT
jgi:predicted nuclease with RNAse H fold